MTNYQDVWKERLKGTTLEEYIKKEKERQDKIDKITDLNHVILKIDIDIKRYDRWWKKYWWFTMLLSVIVGVLIGALTQAISNSKQQKLLITFPKSQSTIPTHLDTIRVLLNH
jgi:hypothetical protein